MSLRKRTFSAVRWTAISTLGKAGLSFAQVAVLARLLLPDDFGLMAIVIAIVAFMQVFADVGLSYSLIHYRQVSNEQLSSLYWLNIAAGAILMVVLMLVSPWLATFYGKPQLQPLVALASTLFLITAASQQFRILAEKELRFAILAAQELAGAGLGFCAALLVALNGGGVYALVWGMLTSALVSTLLAWVYLAQGRWPLFHFCITDIRHFVRFGAYTMANNIVNTFNSQADILLGGRFLGADMLGMYSLPREIGLRVASVVNPIATRVGLPVMAEVQDDRPLLESVYLNSMRMILSVNFPLYAALVIFAPEVVTLLFGDQWSESAPVLRVLALWGLVRSIVNPVGSLLFALGRADLSLKWNLAIAFVAPPSLLYGVQYGTIGLSFAMLAVGILIIIPCWYYLVRPLCGASLNAYLAQLASPGLVTLLAGTAAYAAAAPFSNDFVRLAVGIMSGLSAYAALSLWLNKRWVNAMGELLSWNDVRSRNLIDV